MAGTWIICNPNATTTDNTDTLGDVDWTNGTAQSGYTIAEEAEATGLASGTLTNCGNITLTDGQLSYWRIYTGAPPLCIDAGGTVNIPTDATIVDAEFVLKTATTAGTGVATLNNARFYNNGTIGTDELAANEVIFAAGTTTGTRGQQKCPIVRGLSGETPTRADVVAGSCGVAFRMLATGGTGSTIGNDCLLMKFSVEFANMTVVIRSNKADVTGAPFPYHAHMWASETLDYDRDDLDVVWDFTAYPASFDPGSVACPVPGRPTQHATISLFSGEGYNFSRLLDVAGDYTIRCRIYYQGTLLATGTDSITVAADSRTHAYVDVDATGANDGTSPTDAWTSYDSGIDWLDGGNNRWLHVAAGTYTMSGTGNSVGTQTGCVLEHESGTHVRATTDSGTAMLSFTNCQHFVIIGGIFETANGTELNWGFTADADCRNFYFKQVQDGETGHRIVSLFEMGSAAAGTRRQITFDRCGGGAGTIRYFYGLLTNTSDVVFIGCTCKTAASATTEGLVRVGGGMHVQNLSTRWALQACTIDGNTFGQGPRFGCSCLYISDTYGIGYGSSNFSFCETNSGDSTTNSGRIYTRIVRSALVGRPTVFIGGTAGGGCSDTKVVSSVIVNEAGTGTNGGHARCDFDQVTFLKPASYSIGDNTGVATRTFVSGSAIIQGTRENVIVNSIMLTADPRQDDRSYAIGDDQSGGTPFSQIDNNITCAVSHANGERNNFVISGTATNNAGVNALAFGDGNTRHRSAVQAQFPSTNGYGYQKATFATTVATAASSTSFTLTDGSADDHAYVGQLITVGSDSGTVLTYTASTKTITLVAGLAGGTPSVGAAVTIVTDDTGLGEVALVAETVARKDLRGCTLTRSGTYLMAGATQAIPRGTISGFSLTSENGALGCLFTYSGADTVTFIAYYKLATDALYSTFPLTASGDTIDGLTNGSEYDVRIAAVTAQGGESEWSSEVSGTPALSNRSDNFNRSDGDIGQPSDGGSSWEIGSGNWQVVSNVALNHASTSVNAVMVLESNMSEVEVSVDLASTPVLGGLVIRYTDTSNYIYLDWTTDTMRIRKVAAGSVSTLDTEGSLTIASSDTMKITVDADDLIQGYQNGVLRVSATDSHNNTATKHGLMTDGETDDDQFENFNINAPASGSALLLQLMQNMSHTGGCL